MRFNNTKIITIVQLIIWMLLSVNHNSLNFAYADSSPAQKCNKTVNSIRSMFSSLGKSINLEQLNCTPEANDNVTVGIKLSASGQYSNIHKSMIYLHDDNVPKNNRNQSAIYGFAFNPTSFDALNLEQSLAANGLRYVRATGAAPSKRIALLGGNLPCDYQQHYNYEGCGAYDEGSSDGMYSVKFGPYGPYSGNGIPETFSVEYRIAFTVAPAETSKKCFTKQEYQQIVGDSVDQSINNSTCPAPDTETEQKIKEARENLCEPLAASIIEGINKTAEKVNCFVDGKPVFSKACNYPGVKRPGGMCNKTVWDFLKMGGYPVEGEAPTSGTYPSRLKSLKFRNVSPANFHYCKIGKRDAGNPRSKLFVPSIIAGRSGHVFAIYQQLDQRCLSLQKEFLTGQISQVEFNAKIKRIPRNSIKLRDAEGAKRRSVYFQWVTLPNKSRFYSPTYILIPPE